MHRKVFCLLIVAVLLAACGGDDGNGTDATENPPDEVTGVIVNIDAELLGEVESFDLKDGETIYKLYIDPDIEYPFPLGHLHQHLQTADPVRCEVELRGDKLYAQTIEDA